MVNGGLPRIVVKESQETPLKSPQGIRPSTFIPQGFLEANIM